MLNDRFANGGPSNNLESAGILVRQLDGLNDVNKPWLPCRHTGNGDSSWCAEMADRWATSLVNPGARNLYYGVRGIGGLVVNTRVAKLFCADPADGNSMDPNKICNPPGRAADGSCIPGCYPVGKQCNEVGHAWDCSYAPTHLKECLEAQQRDMGAKSRNNEMVVDLTSITSNLPQAILGFWYTPTSGSKEVSDAIDARRAFLREYHLSPATGPPLLILDLTEKGGDRPFSLAQRAGLG